MRRWFSTLFILLICGSAFGASIAAKTSTASRKCPDPAWDEMREIAQGAPAAFLGGIGSCKTKYGEIHVDDLMSFNRSQCSMTKINLNTLSDTNQTMNNWVAETAVFQEMARRSHGEALCRVGFFDQYDQNAATRKLVNDKSAIAFAQLLPDLKSLITYRNQLSSQLRELDGAATDRAVGSATLSGRNEYRKYINDVNELIVKQLTKIPLGYDPDVARSLTTMAERGSFDPSVFRAAVDSASNKHRQALDYYQNRVVPVSDKSINYCLGKDYRDQAGKLGNVTALMDSLPEPQFDRKLKAKIMCRLDARYGAGAERLSNAELIAFVATLAYSGTEAMAYRGVKIATKVVETTGATTVAGTLQAVGAAGMVDSLEKSCFDDARLITPAGADTCDVTKDIQHEIDGPDHSKCAVEGALTFAPIPLHILKFLRGLKPVEKIVAENSVADSAPTRNAAPMAADLPKPKDFTPLYEPAHAKSEDVAATTKADRAKLAEMGVSYSNSDLPTWLADSDATITQPHADGTVDTGQVLEITGLPKPKAKGNATTLAFEHPEMAAYMNDLHEMGFKVVVDTSLDHVNVGGYLQGGKGTKILALRPNSTWQTFIHEYQHAEFNDHIKPIFKRAAITRKIHGTNLFEILPADTKARFGRKRIARLQKMIDQGLPQNSINETLSCEAELRALGLRRYSPFLNSPEKYGLRHQITDLQNVSNRTPVQQKSLERAIVRYQNLLDQEKTGRAIINIAATTGSIAVPLVGTRMMYQRFLRDQTVAAQAVKPTPPPTVVRSGPTPELPPVPPASQDPNTYKNILVDNSGIAYVQQDDGTWTALHPQK